MVCSHSRLFRPAGGRYVGAVHQRRRSVDLAKLRFERRQDQRTSKAQKTASRTTCVLPTWWLWRSGCTRSHSELGRETLQRQWYFILRCGRVGRCQVCKAHKSKHLLKSYKTPKLSDIRQKYRLQQISETGSEQPVRPKIDTQSIF